MQTRSYRQSVTYWSSPVSNGLGGFSYSAPSVLLARWEERLEEFQDHGGETHMSKAIVWLKQDVDTLGFLYNGVSTEADPTQVYGAFRILQFRKIPGIRTGWERRAYLG